MKMLDIIIPDKLVSVAVKCSAVHHSQVHCRNVDCSLMHCSAKSSSQVHCSKRKYKCQTYSLPSWRLMSATFFVVQCSHCSHLQWSYAHCSHITCSHVHCSHVHCSYVYWSHMHCSWIHCSNITYNTLIYITNIITSVLKIAIWYILSHTIQALQPNTLLSLHWSPLYCIQVNCSNKYYIPKHYRHFHSSLENWSLHSA